jgi:hypothetical protein
MLSIAGAMGRIGRLSVGGLLVDSSAARAPTAVTRPIKQAIMIPRFIWVSLWVNLPL